MNENLATAIGIAAGTCTTVSFLPQLYHIWKRRSAADISGVMFSVFAFGSFLWFLYGIGIHSWPVIVPNLTTFCFNVAVLIMKRHFARQSKVPT